MVFDPVPEGPVTDRFRTLWVLGEGGSAVVTLALAQSIGGITKLVVLKSLKSHLAEDPTIRRSFLREARLSARLNHPGVVAVHEVTEFRGLPTLVMEYLDGQTLASLVTKAGPRLTIPMHLRIIAESLSGLHYSHELTDYDGMPLNLVHRDFTPQNVFLTFAGLVKVLDFGVAKVADGHENTEKGVVKGKLRYMPPEQLKGESLDRRTDLYAVGAMLWEAITRQRLWKGIGEVAVMQKVVAGEIPAPSSVEPNCPAALTRICMKALAPERGHRYQTALDIQSDLEAFLADYAPDVTATSVAQVSAHWFLDVRAELNKTIAMRLADEKSLSRTVMAETAPLPRHRQLLPRRLHRGSLFLAAGAIALGVWSVSNLLRRQTDGRASGVTTRGSLEPNADVGGRLVSVRIAVSPPEAVIRINGKILSGNPYAQRVKALSGIQLLQLDAPGYLSVERPLRLDRDVEMMLSLARSPGHGRVPSVPSTSAGEEWQLSGDLPSSMPTNGSGEVVRPLAPQSATAGLTLRGVSSSSGKVLPAVQ